MSRRIRSIKPEILIEDERAAGLSDAAWRLWVGVRLLADDWGTFRAGDRYLAAQIWQDTRRAKRVAGLLSELAAVGFVSTFEADGVVYGSILTWDVEQRIDDRSPRGKLPIPPEEIRTLASRPAASRSDPPQLPQVPARARPRASSPPGRDTDHGKDPDNGKDPERARAATPVPTDDALAFAYAQGVGIGAAIAIGPPISATDRSRLRQAVAVHAKGEEAIAWVQRQAEAFTRSETAEHVRRSGFPPWAFLQWLNGRGVAKPGVQAAPAGGPIWKTRAQREAEQAASAAESK